jgi:hypothetical protein
MFLVIVISCCGVSYSQISLSKKVSLKNALTKVEATTEYKFSYSESAINTTQTLGESFSDVTIEIFLDYLFTSKNIKHLLSDKQITLFPAKNNRVKFINGYVRDNETSEVLIFATVWDEISKKGVATNDYGYYNLSTTNDSVRLIVSYIGYPKTFFNIEVKNDLLKDLELLVHNELKAVKITDNKSELSSQEGRIELNPNDYNKAPTIGGENDPIRTLALLPGVNTGEDENYIHVRGGNIGENMIMIDGVPVYKLTHFGRLSVVNGDIINKTTFYKSNFPSRYSGRTSSIIDFRVKNGNTKKLQAIGNVGFETAKLALDGPIGKKATFLISGRRNYGSLFKDFVFNNNTSHSNFYDLYGKLNFFHKKGNITISSFFDSDNSYNSIDSYDSINNPQQINTIDDLTNENTVFSGFLSLQANTLLKEKLFWNTQATYYDYAVQNKDLIRDSVTNYNNAHIQDVIFNNYFSLNTEKHNYNFGVNYTYHNMFSILESDSLYYREKLDIHESNVFFEDNFQLNSDWKIRLGGSFSFYSFGKEIFIDILPKLSSDYQLTNYSKVSTSFSRLSQNFHLLPLSFIENTRYTSEIWQSSSSNFSPLTSNIFSLGYNNSYITKLPFSVEGYYKYSQSEKNVIESDLNKLFLGIESSTFNGSGHNYGLEFLLEKKGKLSGWISYTLGWSKKKFKELYGGESFPSPYDRRHIVNIVSNYKINNKITVSGSWSLQSGTPFYQKINSKQQLDTLIVNNESQYKGFEVVDEADLLKGKFYYTPTYKNLNIQFTFSKEKKWGKREWQIGVRNVFNAKKLQNPRYAIKEDQVVIFYTSNKNTLFQDFYPYITYRFIIK